LVLSVLGFKCLDWLQGFKPPDDTASPCILAELIIALLMLFGHLDPRFVRNLSPRTAHSVNAYCTSFSLPTVHIRHGESDRLAPWNMLFRNSHKKPLPLPFVASFLCFPLAEADFLLILFPSSRKEALNSISSQQKLLPAKN
jgi:hypothetical protein